MSRSLNGNGVPLRLLIDVRYRARYIPAPAQLRQFAAAATDASSRKLELGIRVVGAAESARLNGRYRGKPYATNVLSFPYAAMPDPTGARTKAQVSPCFLGDLVLCAPVIRAEARAQGKDLAGHWAHMVVHGILHLRGYDHSSKTEAVRMEGLEARILRRLGFANPYL